MELEGHRKMELLSLFITSAELTVCNIINPVGLSLCLFTSVNYAFIMTKTHYC